MSYTFRPTEYRNEPPIDLPQYFALKLGALVEVVSSREVVLLWSMCPHFIFGMAVLDMPVFRFFYFSRVHIVGWVIVFKARHCHYDSVGMGRQ